MRCLICPILKILIISNSALESDPRVYKQIKYLKELGYFIVTAAKSLSGIEDLFIDIASNDKSIYYFKFSKYFPNN